MKPEIEVLLKGQRGDRLDFYSFVNKETVCRTICAFLNSSGGDLFLGVQEGGMVIGLQNAHAVLSEIVEAALMGIEPQPVFLGDVATHNSTEFIHIRVPNNSQKPYIYKENCYIKNFSETVVANYQQLMQLIKTTLRENEQWELLLRAGAEYDSLNEEQILKMVVEVNRFIKAKAFDEADGRRFLSSFSLMRNEVASHTAILLFSSDIQQFIPQCRVRIALFFGDDRRCKPHSTALITGNLFELYERCYQQIVKMLKNRPDFSLRAMKEALKNALLHNHWASPQSQIDIFLFKDRMEVENSIRRPLNFTDKDLPPVDEPNPLLSHFFFLSGLTSKLGLGCRTVVNESKTFSTKKPKWETVGERFVCTIYGGEPREGARGGRARVTQADEMLNDTIENILFEGVDSGLIDKPSNSVIDALIELIKLLYRRPGQNAEALSKKMNRPKPTVERYLQIYKKIDGIFFEGSPKSGGYFIRESLRNQLLEAEHYK